MHWPLSWNLPCKVFISKESLKGANNRLRLNENKAELIHFSSQLRSTTPLPVLKTAEGSLITFETVRDLGIILDKHLTLTYRKRLQICIFGHLHNWKDQAIDKASTERLVNAFVSSHLDYCNSLLARLPISHISPLQRIQDSAARLITLSRKYDHISPVLRSLHWLPVHSRITFKIILLSYK